MGHNLSIDKFTTQLDDILDINPDVFNMLNADSLKLTSRITQHLKIWKIFEDTSNVDVFGSQI